MYAEDTPQQRLTYRINQVRPILPTARSVRIAPAVLLLGAIFSACELLPSPPTEQSYLPVEVGNSWTYRFHYSYSHSTVYTDRVVESGTVRLMATSAVTDKGKRTVTLRQEVEIEKKEWREPLVGSDTTVSYINNNSEVEWIEYEDGTVRHPFAAELITRFHPTGADTIQVDGGTLRLLHHPTCSSMNYLDLYLEKGRGIVKALFGECLGSAAVHGGGSLELVQSSIE